MSPPIRINILEAFVLRIVALVFLQKLSELHRETAFREHKKDHLPEITFKNAVLLNSNIFLKTNF
jgi:hypothetical protein